MERSCGLHIPSWEVRKQEERGTECVLEVPVMGLRGQSFQHWLAWLPVREQGMELRYQAKTIPKACIGFLEMFLPFLCGEDNQLKHQEPGIGDILEAEEGGRWHTLLESDCQMAREFRASWEGLHLKVTVERAGEDRVDSSTRTLGTQKREGLRAMVLCRALTLHHDQTARPVWVYPKFYKYACAWLTATPSPSPLFREAMAEMVILIS